MACQNDGGLLLRCVSVHVFVLFHLSSTILLFCCHDNFLAKRLSLIFIFFLSFCSVRRETVKSNYICVASYSWGDTLIRPWRVFSNFVEMSSSLGTSYIKCNAHAVFSLNFFNLIFVYSILITCMHWSVTITFYFPGFWKWHHLSFRAIHINEEDGKRNTYKDIF